MRGFDTCGCCFSSWVIFRVVFSPTFFSHGHMVLGIKKAKLIDRYFRKVHAAEDLIPLNNFLRDLLKRFVNI